MGFAALEKVLNGAATTVPSTPFFRYPFYEMTQPTLDDLQRRGIVVFGSDLWANDWVPMTPRQQLKYLIDRLKDGEKGHHPDARHEGPDGRHAAGFPALSA